MSGEQPALAGANRWIASVDDNRLAVIWKHVKAPCAQACDVLADDDPVANVVMSWVSITGHYYILTLCWRPVRVSECVARWSGWINGSSPLASVTLRDAEAIQAPLRALSFRAAVCSVNARAVYSGIERR